MAKTLITEAKAITAEVVLELGTHYNAKDLRSLQAKLTSTARELHCFSSGVTLLGRIGEKLDFEQRLLLRDAAKLIESIGFNIPHAKEKRQRSEVAAKTRQKGRDASAKKLVEYAYPLPCDTLGHKLEIIRLALVLNRAGCFQTFYTPVEFSLRYRNYVTCTSKIFSQKGSGAFWNARVSSLRADLKNEIQEHLASKSEQTAQERFLALQQQVEELYPQVSNDPYETETLRLWSLALVSPEQQEDGQ
ncbi:hypothetical protein [Pseudomonas fluorescens]|uniref:Uncharacterized protein n=1 Tax=Pseudomonas fluorescens TaxID=294 RepID=A0A4Y9TJK6_PSEFL|nr:hypothetical protein [Pseudomonas fluorescens]TFW43107.1 hypothetical protein E4T65_12135 [Pseudomonas fluorescens]